MRNVPGQFAARQKRSRHAQQGRKHGNGNDALGPAKNCKYPRDHVTIRQGFPAPQSIGPPHCFIVFQCEQCAGGQVIGMNRLALTRSLPIDRIEPEPPDEPGGRCDGPVLALAVDQGRSQNSQRHIRPRRKDW